MGCCLSASKVGHTLNMACTETDRTTDAQINVSHAQQGDNHAPCRVRRTDARAPPHQQHLISTVSHLYDGCFLRGKKGSVSERIESHAECSGGSTRSGRSGALHVDSAAFLSNRESCVFFHEPERALQFACQPLVGRMAVFIISV